jgi:hypothetical protein
MRAHIAAMVHVATMGLVVQMCFAVAVASDLSEIQAALVTEPDSECLKGDACEDAVSLRQLRARSEFQVPQSDNVSCKATRIYCNDVKAYQTQQNCVDDTWCRVMDFKEVGGAEGMAWICVPAEKECEEEKYMLEHFIEEQELPPLYVAKVWGEGAMEDIKADTLEAEAGNYHVHRRRGVVPRRRRSHPAHQPWYPYTCKNRNCNQFIHGASCQCTDQCTRYNNWCPDHQEICHRAPATASVSTVAPSTTSLFVYDGNSTEGDGDFHGTSELGGEVKTLFHTTSKEVAQLILASGFKPGHGGWCGGAIYFLDQPHLPKTKYASDGSTKTGAILEAQVDMGKEAHYNCYCRGNGGVGIHAAERSRYNSITFNPGDGSEFIIWDTQQVKSVKLYEYMD